MNFKNESAFNRWWSQRFVEAGAVVLPVVGHEMQQPGWPDRYVASIWWTGWIEGKAGTRLSTSQRMRHEALHSRGEPVYVWRIGDSIQVEWLDEVVAHIDYGEVGRTALQFLKTLDEEMRNRHWLRRKSPC